MQKYLLNLLKRALSRAFSRTGTNGLGFLISTASPTVAFLIGVGNYWLHNGRNKTAALKALATWPSLVPAGGLALLVLAILVLILAVVITYEDHLAQLSHAKTLELQLAQLQAKAVERLTSQSVVPSQSVYPKLEAIQERITRDLVQPWHDGYMHITQMYAPYEAPSYLVGGPQVLRSMTQEQKLQTERMKTEQHELRLQGKQNALEQAVESLAQLDRELGIAYCHLQPSLDLARKAAIECMKLTEAERSSDRSAFSQAETSATRYIKITDLPSKVITPTGEPKFTGIYSYVSDLLRKLANYDCGISSRSRH